MVNVRHILALRRTGNQTPYVVMYLLMSKDAIYRITLRRFYYISFKFLRDCWIFQIPWQLRIVFNDSIAADILWMYGDPEIIWTNSSDEHK